MIANASFFLYDIVDLQWSFLILNLELSIYS